MKPGRPANLVSAYVLASGALFVAMTYYLFGAFLMVVGLVLFGTSRP